jgi:hypothetical protein
LDSNLQSISASHRGQFAGKHYRISTAISRQNPRPKISVKTICRLKAVLRWIASSGDEHDAIIAVWLHGIAPERSGRVK